MIWVIALILAAYCSSTLGYIFFMCALQGEITVAEHRAWLASIESILCFLVSLFIILYLLKMFKGK